MKKFNKLDIEEQKHICNKIITDINAGRYHNASILIRYYLNDNNYYWYKDINYIIDNQISNLFYDIESGSNKTVEFFKHIILELDYILKHEV